MAKTFEDLRAYLQRPSPKTVVLMSILLGLNSELAWGYAASWGYSPRVDEETGKVIGVVSARQGRQGSTDAGGDDE